MAYREDRIGTYQTTFRVETWVRGRKTPRVQYRTTFDGKVEDHNSILELVRKLHAEKDGKASALVEIFEKAEKFEAVKKWCLMFNQCIDSEAVKKKLYEILFPDEVDDLFSLKESS